MAGIRTLTVGKGKTRITVKGNDVSAQELWIIFNNGGEKLKLDISAAVMNGEVKLEWDLRPRADRHRGRNREGSVSKGEISLLPDLPKSLFKLSELEFVCKWDGEQFVRCQLTPITQHN